MVGTSDLRGLFQPEYFYDFVHPCNAGCLRGASPVARGREQQSPGSIPAGFLPHYLVRARQDFFLQAVQHTFDCGHASVELMDLQERGEREGKGGENRPATTARTVRKQCSQQRKASSRTMPSWPETFKRHSKLVFFK